MDQTIGKDPLFCETIASLFSTILYVDLRDGSCTRTSGDMQRAPCDYACFVRDFVKNYASPKKRKALMHALSLAQVKQGVRKSGRYTCFSEKLHPALYKRLSFVLCSDGHTVMLGISDFSEVAKYYRSELQEVVGFNFKDSVTCAYNRNYYEKKLKTSHLSGQVAVVDIDDFKQFNDAYGHDIGDLALKETARAILKHLSPKDVLVRYGGDEFLLFMPKSTPEEAERTLNHIRQEVGAVRHQRFGSMTLSVSIGVVSMQEEQVMDAVYRADRLMYLAKEHKNSVLTEQQFAKKGTEGPIPKQVVLVTDDSPFNRELLVRMLEKNFEVREAEDGEQCMALLEKYSEQVPVLLLDLVMPKMNGFDVLSAMKEKHLLEDIPVIIITSDDSDENIRRAFHMGATDYIHRPFNATLVEQRIRNTAKLSMKQRKLLSVLSEQISEKERTGRLMIDVLSNVVGRINGESAQHMRNMQKTTTMLLERLCLKTNRYGLSPQDCKLISLAASLHDIGKVCIPSEILNKPGKLTPEEFEVVKTHAEKGEVFLRSGELSLFQEEPLIKYAIQICRWHHERYDGKGYPDGLYGDAIPIAAQVVSIADVFDALVSDRVYKKAYSATQAMRMITTGECGCFNPLLVACLEEIGDKLMADVYR